MLLTLPIIYLCIWYHFICQQVIIASSEQQFRSNTALIFKEGSISYQELYAIACRFSCIVAASGVKPRDRVLLMLDNSIKFYVAYFGIW
jgi:acyl-CoA synthetase (AMP-forming)/AMP-acid ligase II